MGKTAISWTDYTDNPIYIRREDGSNGGHWCQKISPGCAHCYAESVNQSDFFQFASHLPYTGTPPEGLALDRDILAGWGRKRKPARRFVGSMTDVFGEWVPREWQYAILDAAAAAPDQTIQLLTKRPDVALAAAEEWCSDRDRLYLPDNVWMGVTVEDQKRADERVEPLRRMTLLGKTWVSYEPALENVNWSGFELIKWLVCGGESGPGARQFDLTWAWNAAQFCQEWRIAFFMKQMGSNPVMNVYDWYEWATAEDWDANLAPLVNWNYADGQPPPDALCRPPFTRKGTEPKEWPSELQVQEFPA